MAKSPKKIAKKEAPKKQKKERKEAPLMENKDKHMFILFFLSMIYGVIVFLTHKYVYPKNANLLIALMFIGLLVFIIATGVIYLVDALKKRKR